MNVFDTVEFLNSDSRLSNVNGAALHLVSSAQIVLHNQTSMVFSNNTGRYKHLSVMSDCK